MIKRIILGAGCFWCTEAVFSKIKGVTKVIPGYSGGYRENPTYEEVCSGETGHAEVAYIEYDNSEISLVDILKIFVEIHDPTSLNRQGYDVGEQYRSAIYYYDDEDLDTIKKFLSSISGNYKRPIVTEVKKVKNFYRAEDYHISYFNNNPGKSYCRYVISPKVEKVEKEFFELIR